MQMKKCRKTITLSLRDTGGHRKINTSAKSTVRIKNGKNIFFSKGRVFLEISLLQELPCRVDYKSVLGAKAGGKKDSFLSTTVSKRVIEYS